MQRYGSERFFKVSRGTIKNRFLMVRQLDSAEVFALEPLGNMTGRVTIVVLSHHSALRFHLKNK